jgi:Transposase IS66 family
MECQLDDLTHKNAVISAPPAPSPIERSMSGLGLSGHSVNRFSDHLPTYRQQGVLARHGMFLARSTLCDWHAQCALSLRLLVDLMLERVVLSLIVNADAAPASVLDPTLAEHGSGAGTQEVVLLAMSLAQLVALPSQCEARPLL